MSSAAGATVASGLRAAIDLRTRPSRAGGGPNRTLERADELSRDLDQIIGSCVALDQLGNRAADYDSVGVASYFARLVGSRDTEADPDRQVGDRPQRADLGRKVRGQCGARSRHARYRDVV